MRPDQSLTPKEKSADLIKNAIGARSDNPTLGVAHQCVTAGPNVGRPRHHSAAGAGRQQEYAVKGRSNQNVAAGLKPGSYPLGEGADLSGFRSDQVRTKWKSRDMPGLSRIPWLKSQIS